MVRLALLSLRALSTGDGHPCVGEGEVRMSEKISKEQIAELKRLRAASEARGWGVSHCATCGWWASAAYRCDGTVCVPASDRRKPCPENEPHWHRSCSNCRKEWTEKKEPSK